MVDFVGDDLRDARFEHCDLRGASLYDVDLANARLRAVDLRGARMSGVEVVDVSISGEVSNLVINGVDVAPLIESELDRRDPDRVKMRPRDVSGLREAWALLERLWEGTVERARALPAERLHQSVNGEWSFIETQRHLVFATDAWVRRAILGDPAPWDRLGLPWDEMPDTPGVPRHREARPSLDAVLELRRGRQATVREFLASLSNETLRGDTTPVEAPGWPRPRAYPLRQCLRIVLNEEWEHRLYAERDLSALSEADA